ncbi:MAG TPA: WD40 repeat domain-containing protein, partial [Verrucomicrobiales bacterium]|nr:WD40 repeat domain-containing protein [Verrucomicrobiales bacterium]
LVLWQRAEQAVVSLTQTNDQLETALRIATATKLAGDARFQIAEDPARALLLAVEAVKTTQETLGGVLPEATTALYDVLQQTGGRDISPFPMEKSSAVPGFLKRMIFEENGAKISPDGKWLLTLDWTETHKNGIRAALFDLEDRNGTEPVRRWEMWPSPGEENFRGISWLGDSRRVLSGNLSGEVILWNVTEASAEGRMTGTPPSRVLGKVDTAGLAFRSGTLRSRPGETTADYYTYFRKAGNDGTDHDSFCLATRFSADGIPVAAKPVRLALPAGMGQPSATVSPDGKWLLTCRADGAGPGYFQRIGPEGASEPAVLPEGSFAVGPRAFSPDSKSLVLQRSAALARVYDLSSGDPVKAAATGRTLSTGVEGCTLIAFSPDSSQVCMVGVGDVVQLQPLDPSKPVYKLRTAGGRGVATAFSPDGRWLFAGGVDRVVRAWRVDRLSEGEPPLEFRGLSSPVMDLAMTRDGRTLVATGIYSSYRRWDFDGFTTGTVPFTCAGGQGSIRDVAVSPDSKWLAMACTSAEGAPDVGPEGEVLLSEPASKKVWNLKSHGGPATGVAFSPDGKWLVSIGSDARAYVYDFREMCRCIHDEHQLPGPVDTLDMTGTRQNYIRRVAVHPRGTLYCTCGDGILFGWDLNAPHPSLTKKEHPIHSIQYLLPDVQVSPDGHWLAVARHGWDREPVKGSDQNGNLVLVYDVSQPGPPVPRATLRAPFLERTSLTFTADSRWLASGSSGQFPVIWDLAAPNPAATARTAPCQDHSMEGVSFSPDRPWLAMAGAEGRIYLWDWEKTGELRTIATDEAVHTLKWLPGGRLLSGGSKGQTQLWETDFQSLIALANKVAGRRLTEEERSKFRVTGSGGKH